VSKRKQIITSIVMGSAVAALSVPNVNAAQPAQADKPNPSSDLLAQTPPAPRTPNQQPLVPNPRITIDNAPTMPRAVAPPVGDISVSNLDATISNTVDLGSNKNIPNLVLKDAPIREVLEIIVQNAGLNLAYMSSNPDDKNNQTAVAPKAEPRITFNLRNEPVQSAFNYVLKMSGYEAIRVGRTVFVGPKLPDSIQENVVRTLRVNQVSPAAVAAFLAAQGAEARLPQETTRSETLTLGKVEQTTTKKTIEVGITNIATANAPILLRGLAVNVDERLGSVTLVGTARKVEIASAMITRLDARRRQVALNVKIVDVNLSNTDTMSNSLSFKVGDGFLSVDKGAAVYNYGGYNPANTSQVLSSPTTPPIIGLNLPGGGQPFLDYQPNANLNGQSSGGNLIDPISGLPVATNVGNIPRPGLGSEANPYQPGVTNITPATTGYVISPSTGLAVPPGGLLTPAEITTPAVAAQPAQPATFNAAGAQLTPFQAATPAVAAVIKAATFNTNVPTAAKYTYEVPKNLQLPTKFLSTLQAQIIAGNGKILTDPTLVVQEGQKSTVNLTQDVFGGFKINSVAGTGATTSTREPIIKEAGLSLDIFVNRIDDNGYVSVGVTPTVSSIGSVVTTQDGDIALLQKRTLNSGEIRLRDGQTLILSGIIQESDRTSVSKVPILGDIPILGALFRSTNKSNQRQEVVVLLTPQILNDNRGQVNYTPGVDARMMIGK
jgi:type IV pilus assembly protein PilQ